MTVKEVIKHILSLEPLNLLLLIEIHNFTSNEKLQIIEEYDNLVKYLLEINRIRENYNL